MEVPKVFKFPHDLQDIGNGWVIQNMKEYGNSALPTDLIKLLDLKTIERMLGIILEDNVIIQKTGGGYVAWII